VNASLVFNDASLPFQSPEECEQYLPVFFDILRRALKSQVQMIRIDENMGRDWYRMNYVAGFSLSQWVNHQTDRDYKRSLKMIVDKTRCPLIFPEEKEQLDAFDASSFQLTVNHAAAQAIGSAFLLDLPVVSFLSHPHWYENSISVIYEYLDEKNDCVQERKCDVENISQQEHLMPFLEKIQAERQASRAYLKSLVEYDNDDYQNLIFCANVLDTFKQIGATEKLLNKIKDVLNDLNEIIETADSNSDIIEGIALSITGESDTTKNHSNLMKYRKFKLPNGSFITFDLHVKNFPDGKRLYFYPDFLQKNIYIGYFGNHLPI